MLNYAPWSLTASGYIFNMFLKSLIHSVHWSMSLLIIMQNIKNCPFLFFTDVVSANKPTILYFSDAVSLYNIKFLMMNMFAETK